MGNKTALTITLLAFIVAPHARRAGGGDALPSWNDGPRKAAIVAFVEDVCRAGGERYVPPAERVAVFDNDGTLWTEKPIYFQLQFAIDRVRELAPDHPEWRTEQPFKAAIEGDLSEVAKSGKEGLFKLVMASHAGVTTDEFADAVAAWVDTARHPRFDRPYPELVYQPMLELLAYLRARGFKTYIVSGGGIEFMRVFAEEVYGVPPEQVIGSSIATRYEQRPAGPVLVREPKLDFLDDKESKPVAINRFIGRRPVMAFGNSDGDLQMLTWTTAGDGPRLGGIVRHTDADREWAYDRDSHVGRLDKALDLADDHGWLLIDMKRDWRVVYPPAGE